MAGRQLLRALDEIAQHHAAWTVAHGFEAFEIFLRDVAAAFIADNPTITAGRHWKPSRQRGAAGPGRHLADCRTFIRAHYHGADDLLPRLRRSLPALRSIERTNSRAVDLADWFRVASEARHATVHNAMVLSAKQMRKMSGGPTPILKKAFPNGVHMKAGFVLRPRREDAQLALELFSEYAYVIYRCCCEAAGREWQELRTFAPAFQKQQR